MSVAVIPAYFDRFRRIPLASGRLIVCDNPSTYTLIVDVWTLWYKMLVIDYYL